MPGRRCNDCDSFDDDCRCKDPCRKVKKCRGATGATGARGPTGATGATGAAGPTGPKCKCEKKCDPCCHIKLHGEIVPGETSVPLDLNLVSKWCGTCVELDSLTVLDGCKQLVVKTDNENDAAVFQLRLVITHADNTEDTFDLEGDEKVTADLRAGDSFHVTYVGVAEFPVTVTLKLQDKYRC